MKLLRKTFSIVLFLSLASHSLAAELLDGFPSVIHPNESYVFYSHGLIVEGTDPRPIHPDFGRYEFPEIVEEIFRDGGFHLIAHHRPSGTDQDEYSDQVVNWVHQLVEAGVRPDNITLVGFSRGAQITLKASNQLSDLGINTAVMAVCFDGDFPSEPEIRLSGRVLSIYETSDLVKSCDAILSRSVDATSTKEIAISTGLEHGAFYTPRLEWIEPLKSWLSE